MSKSRFYEEFKQKEVLIALAKFQSGKMNDSKVREQLVIHAKAIQTHYQKLSFFRSVRRASGKGSDSLRGKLISNLNAQGFSFGVPKMK